MSADAPASPAQVSGSVPAATGPLRTYLWTVRREIWENRSPYIAPLSVAVLMLIGFLLSAVHYAEKMHAALGMDVNKQRTVLEQPYAFVAMLILCTSFLVAVFFCLDALYGERRDRSILFWKSLPISDFVVVFAKATIPLLVIPAIAFVVIIATQFAVLLMSTVMLLASGQGAAAPWVEIPWGQITVVLFYGLATLSIWFAPLYAWLLLASGWAPRAPFLWAVLPPLALAVVEKIAFGTWYIGEMLHYFFTAHYRQAFNLEDGPPIDQLSNLDPVKFISTPSVWIGLLIAALLLVAASLLRRYRGPI
jgi:ABC-2 type transport system permease protein